MTSTSDRFHDPDAAHLAAQVRCLENEVRALRETLRDKFAAAALQGLAHLDAMSRVDMSKEAFRIADAMLDFRNRA